MKKNKYLTTGEFADLCRVEKHVLFYYDQIDLLKPYYIGKNGYRYYSYHQYDTFLVISLLKNLGMPLKEIKKYISDRSPQEFLKLLDNQLTELKAESERLRRKVQYVSEMRSLTDEALAAEKGVIRLADLPEKKVICSRSPFSGDRVPMSDFSVEYTSFCTGNHLTDPGQVGTAIRTEPDGTIDYSRFSFLYMNAPAEDGAAPKAASSYSWSFPAGKYLVVYHQGEYDTLDFAYDALVSFARENSLSIGAFAFEEYILSDAAVSSPSEFVTKIAVAVR